MPTRQPAHLPRQRARAPKSLELPTRQPAHLPGNCPRLFKKSLEGVTYPPTSPLTRQLPELYVSLPRELPTHQPAHLPGNCPSYIQSLFELPTNQPTYPATARAISSLFLSYPPTSPPTRQLPELYPASSYPPTSPLTQASPSLPGNYSSCHARLSYLSLLYAPRLPSSKTFQVVGSCRTRDDISQTPTFPSPLKRQPQSGYLASLGGERRRKKKEEKGGRKNGGGGEREDPSDQEARGRPG